MGHKRGITDDLIGELTASPVPTGQSGCEIFRLDGPDGLARAYLKHGSGPLADDVAEEMTRLRWLRPRLAVPSIIRFVATADECWLVTSVMKGESARALLDGQPDDRNPIVDALAAFLRCIHDLPIDECQFEARLERKLSEARARIDAELVDVADFDQEHQGWSAEDVWKTIERLLPFEPDLVVTHSDFSLDNVLLESTRNTGCIDVGGVGLADRYRDLAICWSDLAHYGPESQKRFLTAYGVGQGEQSKLKAYQLLNELF